LPNTWRRLPPASPKPLPENVDPAAYDDFRDARIEIDFIPRGSGWSHYAICIIAQSVHVSESTAPGLDRHSNWRFDKAVLGQSLTVGRRNTINFVFTQDLEDWSFIAGNQFSSSLHKNGLYAQGDLIDMLKRLDLGLFVGLWPLDDMADSEQIGADILRVRIARRDPSQARQGMPFAAPNRKTAAFAFDGVSGDARRMLAVPPTASGDVVHEVGVTFDEPIVVGHIRIHNNPFQPTREIALDVADETGTFREIWRGILPRGRPEWREERITDVRIASPVELRSARFRLIDGWEKAAWGVNLLEIFPPPECSDNYVDDIPIPGTALRILSTRELSRSTDSWTFATRIVRTGTNTTLDWRLEDEDGIALLSGTRACGSAVSPATFFLRIDRPAERTPSRVRFELATDGGPDHHFTYHYLDLG
jgi:hypothetical protein